MFYCYGIDTMFLFRRFVIDFSIKSKICALSEIVPLELTLQRLPVNDFQCKKQFSCSPGRLKEDELPSSLSKYEIFPEKITTFVLDVEKEREKYLREEKVFDEFEGISLERGKTGVIDVEELVELLKREKAQDIFVIKIPQEFNYGNFKVLVTGKSQRHMLAMIDFIRRLYKKRVGDNKIPQIEGKRSKDWMAIDLDNVILHVFSAAARQVYDLETLWSVGKDYDEILKSELTFSDKTLYYKKLLADLTPNA